MKKYFYVLEALYLVPVAKWLACLTAKQEICNSNPGILPLHVEKVTGQYIGKGVTSDVNLKECIPHMPLPKCQ